jgi:hypothetical protein
MRLSNGGSESSPQYGIRTTVWTKHTPALRALFRWWRVEIPFCFTPELARLPRPRVQSKIFENAATIYGIAPQGVIKAPRQLDMARRANANDCSALGERRRCRDIRYGEYGQHEDREKTR